MGSEGYVEGVYEVPGEDAVNVSLEQGVTYELRMAKVGVGSATSEEGAEYVTAVQGDGVSIAEAGSQKLVVEVRDRFNNPVSNVTVDASIVQSAGAGDDVTPSSATTDSDGEATFTYEAPEDVTGTQAAKVNATFGGGGDEKSRATLDVAVLDSDGSGGGGGGGGGADDSGTNDVRDVAIPTGMRQARKRAVVLTGRAVIAVGGGPGTLSELAFAIKYGRPVYGVGTWSHPRFPFDSDLSPREVGVLVPLAVLVLVIGLYPKVLLDKIEPSTEAILDRIEASTDYRVPDPGRVADVVVAGGEE
jgi:hypothetical protein